MRERMNLTQDDCREVFRKLLKVCEPERVLLGEVGFLQLLTGKPDLICFSKQISRLDVHFEGRAVYYVTVDEPTRTTYYTHPRTGTSVKEAVAHWNQMIQERT